MRPAPTAKAAACLRTAAGVFAVFATIGVVWHVWSGTALDFVSGVWLAQGIDLQDGVFYRPLVSERGFGGTRYFPLWIVLHAALLELGLGPVAAGHVMSIAAGLALVIGAAWMLEGFGLERRLSLPLGLLTLSPMTGGYALTSIRGDLLAVALNVWGVALAVRATSSDGARWLRWSVLLFVLAIMTKPSAAYGVAGVAAALVLAGRWRTAGLAAVATAAGVIVSVMAADLASSGRMLEVISGSAFAGAGVDSLLGAPHRFVTRLALSDPVTVVSLAFFAAALVVSPGRSIREPVVLTTLASAATVFVLYGMPGANINHQLDLAVFAILALGLQVARGSAAADQILIVFSMAVLLAVGSGLVALRRSAAAPGHAEIEQVWEVVGDSTDAPILSDDPMVPSAVGQPAFVLDPWMLERFIRRDSTYTAFLESRVSEARFPAIVLRSDPRTTPGHAHLARTFGPGFLEALEASYVLAAEVPPYLVYRPAGGSTGAGRP